MEEIKYNNATVRIHGSVDRERIEVSTINFMKKVEKQRRKKGKK